ncbi:MAG: hypothetical protein U0223_21445 [Nitrospira sp.]
MSDHTTSPLISTQNRLLGLLAILILIVVPGCAFGRATLGDKIKQEDLASLTKGMTTRAEVVARIGAPDRILQANGQEILQYYHYDLKSSSLLLLLVNFSRFNIKSDDLYVLINHDGLVDEVLYGRRTDTLAFQAWPFGE